MKKDYDPYISRKGGHWSTGSQDNCKPLCCGVYADNSPRNGFRLALVEVIHNADFQLRGYLMQPWTYYRGTAWYFHALDDCEFWPPTYDYNYGGFRLMLVEAFPNG